MGTHLTPEQFKQMNLIDNGDGTYSMQGKAVKNDGIKVALPGKPKGRPDLEKEQTTLYEKWYGNKVKINIKPLSVNQCWQGRRYKAPIYKEYTKNVKALLPEIKIPKPPYEIYYKFGFSSLASDWDNCIKPTQDLLADHYNFNDKLIKRAVVDVVKVDKGSEFFEFKISEL